MTDSYRAIVLRASRLRPHPNADRLALLDCLHYQVIVGRDTQPGQLVVFFEAGGQLSEDFAYVNKLTRKDGGMFEPNLRVKPIKLRGQRSDGFAIPVESLMAFGDPASLKEGDEFSTFGGVEICRKYESPETKRARGQRTSSFKVKLRNFPEHKDTSDFRREGRFIPAGSVLWVSEKCHGTSGRTGHVQVMSARLPRFPSWISRIATRLFGYRYSYKHVNGTRRVMLYNERQSTSWHGGDRFRFRAVAGKTLLQNEVIYYELVGFDDNGNPIQKQSCSHDKDVEKLYGPTLSYTYGALGVAGDPTASCLAMIYRISHVSNDGVEIDYSWPQVKRRAEELGMDVVPVVRGPIVYDGDFDSLYVTVDEWVNGKSGTEALPSVLDNRHIREGAVIRAETPDGRTLFYKHRSWVFLELEGVAAERGQVDVEDVQKGEDSQ